MTISAQAAFQMTQNSDEVLSTEKINQELTLAEQRILNATTYGMYKIVYQASLIGNPFADPSVDSNLSPEQLAFRNSLFGSGYVVGQDDVTGYWTINWAQQGPEQQVTIYQINTTIVPGSVTTQTRNALNAFFTALSPSATDVVNLAGSAISGTYVHIVLVHQQNGTDHSAGVLSALAAAGAGYTSGNTSVSKR